MIKKSSIKKNQIHDSIKKCFEEYFTSQGFEVFNNNSEITATYKTTGITLEHIKNPLAIELTEAYLAFDLYHDTKTSIIVKKNQRKASLTKEVNDTNKSEAEKKIDEIRKEISNMKKYIENIDGLMDKVDEISVYYEIKGVQGRFDNFKQVLEHLFPL